MVSVWMCSFFTPLTKCVKCSAFGSLLWKVHTLQWLGPMFFRVHITTSTYCLTKVDDVRIATVSNRIHTHTSMQNNNAAHVWKIWQQPKNNKSEMLNEIITISLEHLFNSYFSCSVNLPFFWRQNVCVCERRIYVAFSWHIRQTGMKWTTATNDRSSF